MAQISTLEEELVAANQRIADQEKRIQDHVQTISDKDIALTKAQADLAAAHQRIATLTQSTQTNAAAADMVPAPSGPQARACLIFFSLIDGFFFVWCDTDFFFLVCCCFVYLIFFRIDIFIVQ